MEARHAAALCPDFATKYADVNWWQDPHDELPGLKDLWAPTCELYALSQEMSRPRPSVPWCGLAMIRSRSISGTASACPQTQDLAVSCGPFLNCSGCRTHQRDAPLRDAVDDHGLQLVQASLPHGSRQLVVGGRGVQGLCNTS